jgi:uncharacterized membrane protein YeaQ/YmgE (transglycosylase-associated protein family)
LQLGSAALSEFQLQKAGLYVVSSVDCAWFARRFHREQDCQKQGEGLVLDILLGIVGAIARGWLFNTLGDAGVTGLNLYSLLVAVIGCVVLLVAYHAVRRAA